MARFAYAASTCLGLLLATAMITACGSTAPTITSARRSSQAAAQQSGIGYARCMRAHGVTRFPDPPATGGGFDLAAAGINQSSPAVRSAETACKTLLPVKHVPNQRPTAAAYARLLHWASCMRTHGISGLRDPKPNPPPTPDSPAARGLGTLMGDGGYWIGIPSNVDAHSPAFERLSTRCGESPSGH